MAILSEKRQKCFGLRRKDVRMRAIICDDDGRFAKKLEQLIMQYYRNMGMTIDTTVVTNPQNLLKRNDLANFDIAFLDADMKPIDGIEVGRALRKRKPKIIIVFVSAYLEFAPKDTQSMHFATSSNRISRTHCLYAFRIFCNILRQTVLS
jgi:DNA-binding LytR/AlgR family response regulator